MSVEQVKSVRRQKAIYKTSSGEIVPGVTTILALRAKPALVEWGFRIGKDNPNLNTLRDYVDDLADIGTCAHDILNAHFRQTPPDLGDFSPNVVTAAQHSVDKYHEWAKGKDIEVLAQDLELVSDRRRFGGKLDAFLSIDGKRTVVDLKTGRSIYFEHVVQVAAYAEMLREKGDQVDEVRVLQIGRTGAEGFTERVLDDWANHWAAFLALRDLYAIEKCIEHNERWTREEIA
jgi:PD-(D/E)XK nuclease superfamily protein